MKNYSLAKRIEINVFLIRSIAYKHVEAGKGTFDLANSKNNFAARKIHVTDVWVESSEPFLCLDKHWNPDNKLLSSR